MTNSEQNIDRRTFLSKSAAAIAGGSALANTALSYGRILGANDRILLCHVGNGSRGGDLDLIVSKLASSHNVEMNAVCDLWRLNREKGSRLIRNITVVLPGNSSTSKTCSKIKTSTR